MKPILFVYPEPELHFKGPYSQVSRSKFSLRNPTDAPVCFKIKTTALRKYCVRPNCGVIEPYKTVVVSAMLQPMDPKTICADNRRHKLMVQSMFAPRRDVDINTVWQEAHPDDLMYSQLWCIFDPPFEDLASSMKSIDTKANRKENAKSEAECSEEHGKTYRIFSPKPCALIHTSSSSSDEEAACVQLEVKKLVESNRKLRDELAQMFRKNSRLKEIEEGFRQRLTQSTLKLQEVRNTNEKEKEQRATLLHKLPCFHLFCAAMIFLFGLVFGWYLM